ncbi:MAG TPA: hypothetical protein VKG65_01045 [Terriglobales bacterium]|nr:hypothetical protein [Terriglobales bacterium]
MLRSDACQIKSAFEFQSVDGVGNSKPREHVSDCSTANALGFFHSA